VISVARVGEHRRLVYWCPECQTRLDAGPKPKQLVDDDRPTDRHPAAVLFLEQAMAARARRAPEGRVVRRHG